MREACSLIWATLVGFFQSRASLVAEIVVLRHQINIQRRHLPARQTFGPIDRLIFAGLYQSWLAYAELRLGRFKRAADRARQAITIGTENEELPGLAWSSLVLGEALIGLGEGGSAETRSTLKIAAELADRHGLKPLAERVNAARSLI
jgi:hypothetical protein